MSDLATTKEPLHKSQLDEAERRHLERVVTALRARVEQDVRFQVGEIYGLKKPEAAPPDTLDAEGRERREQLLDAVRREQAGGKSWQKALDLYVKGVGYTLVNRLAALRCMEVRGFIDRAVTRFRSDGRTPASDPLINDEFYAREEGILEAFRRTCRQMTEEIEILFDLGSPYSLVEPTFETFEALCAALDEVSDAAWRADDVLGWVYEYYNAPDLDEVRRKADKEGLDPEDVPAANQFYTPHWVVRMLADNSLGKLYLERRGTLQATVEAQKRFSLEERKARPAHEAASIEELCTYLVATEETGEATDFAYPSEIRVLDPACGSGHFLLYSFDILERIWWEMAPEVDRAEVPRRILQHNLFGVDLDLRACQLAAFNLYLKARTRAEEHGAADFRLPPLGIVCADAHVADLDRTSAVFDEVAGENAMLRGVLGDILDAFETVEGLGGLLDVRGTLQSLLQREEFTLFADEEDDLSAVLATLHEEAGRHREGDSFRARDLRSFLRLLVVLSQDYDVALMNPPYGSRNRIPDGVKAYIEAHYDYDPEFYINFFEVCRRLAKKNGRIGMLVPRSFMFKRTFEPFRKDFISGRGAFDFLAEYGIGVLDKATVRTVGTVVRADQPESADAVGDFIRLHDVDKEAKEGKFLEAAFEDPLADGFRRRFARSLKELQLVPGLPLSYWVPLRLRKLYDANIVFDAENAGVERESLGVVKQGVATGKDPRFVQNFWENAGDRGWVPFAKGGEDAWILPRVVKSLWWAQGGEEVKRYAGSYPRNEQYFFHEALRACVQSRGGGCNRLSIKCVIAHKIIARLDSGVPS